MLHLLGAQSRPQRTRAGVHWIGGDTKPRQGAGPSPCWARGRGRGRAQSDPKGGSQPPAQGDPRTLPGAFINSQAKLQIPMTCKMSSLVCSDVLISTSSVFFNNGFSSGHILVHKKLNGSSSLNQGSIN